jgi:hypothetical protein
MNLTTSCSDTMCDNLLPKFLLSEISDKEDRWSLKQLNEDSEFCEANETDENPFSFHHQVAPKEVREFS